jgi:MarR family transcriptional regulator, 2-MHQ and catechol-resistance regulon repressor
MTRKRYGEDIDRALGMWVKLARAFATVNRLVVDNVRRLGMTLPQFGVIECLAHLGPQTLGELSRKHLTSCGNTTVVVDNLQRQGLVERRQADRDRRTTYVHLTPRGKRTFEKTFLQNARFVQRLASVLSPAEQETLSALLKKLGLSLMRFRD